VPFVGGGGDGAVEVGSRCKITNWDVLAEALSVRSITIDDGIPDSEVALDNLPHLESVTVVTARMLSATRNPHVQNLGLELARLPVDLLITAPVSALTIVSSGIRVLPALLEPSKLRRLTLSGAKSFDLDTLRDATNLAEILFFNCRELLGAETLVGLPELNVLEINGARNIPGSEKLLSLAAENFWVENNYVFDDEFQLHIPGGRHWLFSRFKGSAKKASPEDGFELRMGVDAETFAPFVVAQRADGAFELTFDDWIALSDALGQPIEDVGTSGFVESLAQAIILARAPEVLANGTVQFDSESDAMHLVLRDASAVNHLGNILRTAWNNRSGLLDMAAQVEGH
jgi:hypothetical protein